MPVTSGTYNVNTYTAEDVITAALRRCRVLAAGQAASVNDMTDCALELDNLLKMWETKGLLLWLYDLITIPLVQNQYRYTIGPGGDINPGYRPLRAMEGTFLRYTCQPCPNDITLQLLSRVEWLQLSNKICPSATPNAFYYDVQMDASQNPVSYDPYAQGRGVLYIYPPPALSTYSVGLNVQRPIQDITAPGQTFDLPKEWYYALVKCLASEIADYYEVPEDRITRIKKEAIAALEYIADWGGQEWAPTYFQPDFQFSMPRGYR